MARHARLVFAGQPHLLAQRAAPGLRVFEDDADRQAYLAAAFEAARSGGVAVHAHALGTTRVLMLATPARAGDLARFMQRLGRRYVAAHNARHGRSGSPWAGRFGASVLDPGECLLDAVVFVEQLPLRDLLCGEALDWDGSSAAHHAGRRVDRLVEEHPMYWRLGNTPFERQARHAALLASPLPAAIAARFEAALRGGWPVGSPAFLATLAGASRAALQPGPRGRPARRANAAR